MPAVLAAATMIPLAAAGREDVFFFGTLTHEAVLARVLDRPLGPGDRVPASLPGYRRVRAKEASYPVLVPAAGLAVEGFLLKRPSARDIGRVNHFEADEYAARCLPLAGGGRAWVFVALDALPSTDEPWDPVAWSHAHMPAYLAEVVDFWMVDAPA